MVKQFDSHMVTEPAGDYGVMHHRLIRLILEVAVPSRPELWTRPRVHLLQLLFCWSNLYTRLNTIGSKWTGSIEIPLVEDLLLNFRIATYEIVEGLYVRLRAEDGECL